MVIARLQSFTPPYLRITTPDIPPYSYTSISPRWHTRSTLSYLHVPSSTGCLASRHKLEGLGIIRRSCRSLDRYASRSLRSYYHTCHHLYDLSYHHSRSVSLLSRPLHIPTPAARLQTSTSLCLQHTSRVPRPYTSVYSTLHLICRQTSITTPVAAFRITIPIVCLQRSIPSYFHVPRSTDCLATS
jgi:hypothetical protein